MSLQNHDHDTQSDLKWNSQRQGMPLEIMREDVKKWFRR